MLGFAAGVALSYLAVGVYVYSIGKPLNHYLSLDYEVTWKAVIGWPSTIRRVMQAGVTGEGALNR